MTDTTTADAYSAVDEKKEGAPQVRKWRPTLLLQQEPSDCGLTAVVAIASMYGHDICPRALRHVAGSTARGLTVRNLRDLLRLAGFGAEVIRANSLKSLTSSGPVIGLWRKKHFVVLGRRRGRAREVFDPSRGWRLMRNKDLESDLEDVAVAVTTVPEVMLLPTRARFPLWSWLGSFPIRRALLTVSFFTLLAQLFAIGLPWITGNILDAAVGEHTGAQLHSSGAMLAYFIGASVFALISRAVTSETSARIRRNLTSLVSSDISARVFAKPLQYLRSHVPDVLAARMLGAYQLRDLLTDDMPNLLVNGFLVAGALWMMCTVSPTLAMLAVVGVVLKAAIDAVIRPRQLEAQEEEFWCRVRQQSTLVDFLRSAAAVRHYRAIPSVLERLGEHAEQYATANYQRGMIGRIQTCAYGLLDVADRTIFLVLGTWLVGNWGLSAGTFLAMTLYRETLVGSLDSLRSMNSRVLGAQAAAGRLEDVVLKQELRPVCSPELEGVLDHSGVSLQNVSFRYSRFLEFVIDNLSLDVREGENVAIVAPSGKGKSTLAKLIAGALAPEDGTISIGSIDLSSSRAEIAMRAVSTVMQDDTLCAGSIRENIDMFRGASLDQIRRAAEIVEMREWIESLPMRYETEVSDTVLTISGGQRQRLLLARALCGDVRVVVMDEATSHVDVEMEKRIADRIRNLGLTVITFAHRPETIQRADRVFRLEELMAGSHRGREHARGIYA